MRTGAIATALVSSILLAALAFAEGEHNSNKWRIELDGTAQKTGDIQFRVTPRQGESVDVVATIRSGRGEENVAKDVRDALQNKLSPLRYDIESDDGEDVLVKREDNQPKFALELVRTDVPSVAVHIESE